MLSRERERERRGKKSTRESMGNWSQLPWDVLNLIIDRLSLKDSIRLGCVCPPWRSAATPSRHRGRLPWLLLPTHTRPTQDEERNAPPENAWLDSRVGFFSLLDHHLYAMEVPPLACRRVIGSSNGWLITILKNGEIILINPFSNAKPLLLPTLRTVPGVHGYRYSEGEFFFTITDHPTSCARQFGILQHSLAVRDNFIKKAIASSARFLICIVGQFRKLLIHNPKVKSAKWFVIYDQKQYLDVAFYKGRFYAIDSGESVAVLEGLDGDKPFTTTVITGGADSEYGFDCLYLVESSGDLLKVLQYRQINKQAQQNDTTSNPSSGNIAFKVFKLDFVQVTWVEVNDLGDQAIFLCSTHSSSVSTSDFPDCKGNCIYLACDGTDNYVRGGIYKYKLEDGTFDTVYSNENSVILPTPVWYTSMQEQW